MSNKNIARVHQTVQRNGFHCYEVHLQVSLDSRYFDSDDYTEARLATETILERTGTDVLRKIRSCRMLNLLRNKNKETRAERKRVAEYKEYEDQQLVIRALEKLNDESTDAGKAFRQLLERFCFDNGDNDE